MSNFLKDEIIGREKFLSILDLCNIKLYFFTEEKYNPVDCFCRSKSGIAVEVEIKVRSREFPTLFMEAIKLLKMKDIIKLGLALLGLYVNFIGNKCFIFRIDLIKKSNGCFLSREWVNAKTACDSYKTIKWMVNLPVDLAKILIYEDGKWLNFKTNKL